MKELNKKIKTDKETILRGVDLLGVGDRKIKKGGFIRGVDAFFSKEKEDENLPNLDSMVMFERVKMLVEKRGKNIEWLAKELDMKTKATLYTGFKKGTITIKQIQAIAKIFGVHPFYFFENAIVERLTDEIVKHQQNPDLKGFLLGFSKDVNKGMQIEDAANKNINPNWLAEKMV